MAYWIVKAIKNDEVGKEEGVSFARISATVNVYAKEIEDAMKYVRDYIGNDYTITSATSDQGEPW